MGIFRKCGDFDGSRSLLSVIRQGGREELNITFYGHYFYSWEEISEIDKNWFKSILRSFRMF